MQISKFYADIRVKSESHNNHNHRHNNNITYNIDNTHTHTMYLFSPDQSLLLLRVISLSILSCNYYLIVKFFNQTILKSTALQLLLLILTILIIAINYYRTPYVVTLFLPSIAYLLFSTFYIV